MHKIVIDPVTRIEGHLKIEAVLDEGEVKDARCSGTLWRGIETILRGRDPRDAQRITQRICGVCPTAHAMASSLALDEAFGVSGWIPDNGRIMRNLILGSEFIHSHILHFYHLAALDFVDVAAVADYAGGDSALASVSAFIARGATAPFLPRYEGDYRLSKDTSRAAVSHYVEALDARREAHEMLAIFGGRMPHDVGIFPGGALEQVSVDKIAAFRWRLERLRHFIDNVYLPDVLAVAGAYTDYFEVGRGPGRYLSYGAWDQGGQDGRTMPAGTMDVGDGVVKPLDPSRIAEQVKHSWYRGPSDLHPSHGETDAAPEKPGAYSFLKAPRYGGEAYEVGPLARVLVAYAKGVGPVVGLVDHALGALGAAPRALQSVMGRHAARAIECKVVADAMADWVLGLDPGKPACAPHTVPETGVGAGLIEVPRGALGHWIEIEGGRIKNYQAVVPTTWNLSPRDDRDLPGPCEQALIGTRVRDAENPFELVRIVRSFDPCIACAVHLVTPRRREIGRFRVA